MDIDLKAAKRLLDDKMAHRLTSRCYGGSNSKDKPIY